MKFKQFLGDKKFDEFLTHVKRDCSDCLKHSEYPLLRGTRSDDEDYKIDKERVDRRPKDSSHDRMFNNGFNLGIEAIGGPELIRTKAYFCSNQFMQAHHYGTVYIVMPANGAKFLVSSKISDSFEDVNLYDDKTNFNKTIYQLMNTSDNLTIDKLRTLATEHKVDKKTFDENVDKLKDLFKNYYGYFFTDNQQKAIMAINNGEILVTDAPKFYRIELNFACEKVKAHKLADEADFEFQVWDRLKKIINDID